MQSFIQLRYLFILLIFVLFSCKSKKYYPIQADIKAKSVTAHDLEEDGYFLSTGDDEVHFRFKFAALDEEGNVVSQIYSGYDYMVFDYRGQTEYIGKGADFYIPAGGSLFISLSLIEDDDYSAFTDLLDTAADIAEIVETAESRSRSKKRIRGRYAVRGLSSKALGRLSLLFQIVDLLDTNDQLLAVCGVISKEDLKKFAVNRKDNFSVTASGTNYGDFFQYTVNLSLDLEEQTYAKPKKERASRQKKATASKSTPDFLPSFFMNVAPAVGINDLNSSWIAERPGGGTTYSYNYSELQQLFNYGANIGVNITPTFGRKRNRTFYKKLFLEAGFQHNALFLNSKEDHIFPASYFNNPAGTPFTFSYSHIRTNVQRYMGGLSCRLFYKSSARDKTLTYFDIGGGMMTHRGKLNFDELTFDRPDITLQYDESSEILEHTNNPYGKLGIGFYYKHFHLGLSLVGYQPEYVLNNNYQIRTDNGNGPVITSFLSEEAFQATTVLTVGLEF